MPKTTRALTFSALVIALYLVIMFFTQSFAFGAYQIRISTALYALAYLCPFLAVPFGLANLLANTLFGGLGLPDMIGGCLVGITVGLILGAMGKAKLHPAWVALPIILVPGLGVALWLSPILNIPYPVLAINLLIGQTIPGLCGIGVARLAKNILSKGDFLR